MATLSVAAFPRRALSMGSHFALCMAMLLVSTCMAQSSEETASSRRFGETFREGRINRLLADASSSPSSPICDNSTRALIHGPFGVSTLGAVCNCHFFTQSDGGIHPISLIEWTFTATARVKSLNYLRIVYQESSYLEPAYEYGNRSVGVFGSVMIGFGEFIIKAQVATWGETAIGAVVTTSRNRTVELGVPRALWGADAEVTESPPSSEDCEVPPDAILAGIIVRGSEVKETLKANGTLLPVQQISLYWDAPRYPACPRNQVPIVQGNASSTEPYASLGFPDPAAQLLWYTSRSTVSAPSDAPQPTFFRTFTSPKGGNGTLHAIADDFALVYVNGQLQRLNMLGQVEVKEGALVQVNYYVRQVLLRAGTNTIAIHAGNRGGAAAVAATVYAVDDNTTVLVQTNNAWRYRLSPAATVLGSPADILPRSSSALAKFPSGTPAKWIWGSPEAGVATETGSFATHNYEFSFQSFSLNRTRVRLHVIADDFALAFYNYHFLGYVGESDGKVAYKSFTFPTLAGVDNLITIAAGKTTDGPTGLAAVLIADDGTVLAYTDEKWAVRASSCVSPRA